MNLETGSHSTFAPASQRLPSQFLALGLKTSTWLEVLILTHLEGDTKRYPGKGTGFGDKKKLYLSPVVLLMSSVALGNNS